MKIAKKLILLILIAFMAALVCTAVVGAALSNGYNSPSFVAASAEQTDDDGASLLADEAENAETQDNTDANSTLGKAIAAGVTICLAAVAGAIAMGIGMAKAMDGISRQPEAASNIRSTMMLGLVFIETVVIYALIVSVLLIFVL